MANKLTPKQEGFVQDVFTGVTYTQAYRNNYDAENMSDECIWVKASELMSNGKVAVRLVELQMEAAERSQVTVMSITKELEEARVMAQQEAQTTAMVSASMGKAKVNGLLVERSVVDIKGKLDTKWTVEVISASKVK